MSEFIAPLTLGVTLVLVAAIVCRAALSAWRGWLDLKRLELGRDGPRRPVAEPETECDTGALIELAGVKERLRRLEAIASGVEL
jgi:hypothetical protein